MILNCSSVNLYEDKSILCSFCDKFCKKRDGLPPVESVIKDKDVFINLGCSCTHIGKIFFLPFLKFII